MNSRQFDPVEAAYAVAQYLPADPALWVERCALAGITLIATDSGLYQFYSNGAVEADRSEVTFLQSWLNLTPGGTQAVNEYLRERQANEAAT